VQGNFDDQVLPRRQSAPHLRVFVNLNSPGNNSATDFTSIYELLDRSLDPAIYVNVREQRVYSRCLHSRRTARGACADKAVLSPLLLFWIIRGGIVYPKARQHIRLELADNRLFILLAADGSRDLPTESADPFAAVRLTSADVAVGFVYRKDREGRLLTMLRRH